MKRAIAVAVLFVIVSVNSSAQHAFDRRQVEREVMSVLDAFIEAFNRQEFSALHRDSFNTFDRQKAARI